MARKTLDPAGNANYYSRNQVFRGFGFVFRPNLSECVREFEGVAIGLKTELTQLGDALLALLQNVSFEGQEFV